MSSVYGFIIIIHFSSTLLLSNNVDGVIIIVRILFILKLKFL